MAVGLLELMEMVVVGQAGVVMEVVASALVELVAGAVEREVMVAAAVAVKAQVAFQLELVAA